MGKTLKPVKLPENDRVPRWLLLTGEIDLRLFILEQMQADATSKAPIVRMIDEATGFDKELQRGAEEIIAELRWLRKEYDNETKPAKKEQG
jgi:hypothetical protein